MIIERLKVRIFTGTDIIEINRIKQSIDELGDSFKNRIYTEKEIKYCESKKNAKYQHYAARFAAKEAIFKAVSRLLEDKFSLSWKDAEIVNDENGKPEVKFLIDILDDKIENIDISISHCKEYAVANVVVIGK